MRNYIIIVLMLLGLTFLGTSVVLADLNNGLVAYYPFNGNATDESGNGNNGTVNGATLTTDRFGKANSAYSFDGVDYIKIADSNSLDVDNVLTIAAWAKTSSNSHDQMILEKGGWDSRGNGEYGLLINEWPTYTGKARFQIYEATPSTLDTINPVNDGDWNFIAGTWDGNRLSIYVDGQLDNQVSANGTMTKDNEDVIIGSRYGSGDFFQGIIDDIRIYNRSLSASEIVELYNYGSTPTSPTVTTKAATNVKSNTSTLNGTVNANGGTTTAWFEYGVTSGTYSSTTSTQTISSGWSDTSVTADISGLSSKTTYYYRLVAQNSVGTTYGSELSFATTAPPTVTTSSATNVTMISATLNGTVNANGTSTTAWFEYGKSSGAYDKTTTTQSVSGSSDTSVSIYVSGLSSRTGYYYRLVAQNNAGVSYGSENSFSTITSSTPVPTPTPTSKIKWYISTIDSTGNVGDYTSIAVDSNNKVHISYRDTSNQDLKYATNRSGSWIASTIDSSGTTGWDTSIAIGLSNIVHISYKSESGGDLKYATNASGSWNTQTIDSNGWDGAFSSIAIDSNGKVHIAYYDQSSNKLEYATNVSGSWVITAIDSVGDGWNGTCSLVTDSNNKIHISYYEQDNGDIKYANNISDSWNISTIDSSGDTGSLNAIAIDGNGKLHVAYYDTTNNSIKYATNTSGSWSSYTIDSSGWGWNKHIAVDSGGKAHICYRDTTNQVLKYATNSGGSWATSIIDSSGNVGSSPSIAVDSTNNLHISYYDSTNGNLKYATNAGISTIVTPTPTTSTPTPTPTTLTDWITNPTNGHLYKLIDGSWQGCEDDAVGLGGHLVTINDEDEQNWLVSTFGSNEEYGIGFTDKNEEGRWEWISGEEATYTNWASGEPNNCGNSEKSGNCEDEDYAVMNCSSPSCDASGQWNDVPGCSKAIIEKNAYETNPTPTPKVSPSPLEEGVVLGFVYGEDEDPMRGVTVTIVGANGRSPLQNSTETDGEGYYEFTGLAAGDYTLTYEKEGYITENRDVSLEGDETVVDVDDVFMEEIQKGSIYGYVVDIRGAALEKVKLKLKGVKTKVTKTASSDRDGFFEFEDLDPDTYRVAVTKKFYKKVNKVVKLEEGEDKEIEIEMKKTSKRVLEMIADGQE